MANAEHVERLREGVKRWNAWRIYAAGVPDLSGADLSGADLIGAKLGGARLGGADLSRANLSAAKLIEADLIGAHLSKADLRGAHLSKAHLSGANLIGADLSRAYLVGADLSRAHLSGANLTGAHLRGTRLLGADFNGARLIGADFSQANLSAAHFRRAHLNEANLSEANLIEATLNEADLGGVNLSKAKFGWTVLAAVDLSAAIGLETVRHSGPSTVGIDTLNRSGGRIPDVFLRGAGVPDNLIAYIASLVGKPIEFHSCFISYSTKDQTFANRLHADLRAKRVRCWFAPHDVSAGKKLHEQIDEAIRLYDRLLLILSEHSMESEWVKTEIAKARKREVREKRRMLFPLSLVEFSVLRDWECFDADTGKDSAREIREYFIPDFSCWKAPDCYQKAFDRLLRDLKTKNAVPA